MVCGTRGPRFKSRFGKSFYPVYRILHGLGYPYVYVHQGDHEHLISFVEARLLSADDGQKLSSYPFERSSGMIHSKMCMVCNTFIAKWITEKNDRVSNKTYVLYFYGSKMILFWTPNLFWSGPNHFGQHLNIA